MRRLVARGTLLGVFMSLVIAGAGPPLAAATFHHMKVREVFTGGAAGGSYIELQMWEGGQHFVSGHNVTVYSSTGTLLHDYPMTANVGSGTDQKTVLIAGPGYTGPAADFVDADLNLPAAGGAACFADSEPPDCVSWGAFTGNASLPNSAGTPVSAGGVTAGKALHRSIAGGCATLLEPGDDTNNSAADFSEQDPDPRPNSAAVEESQCTLPNTTINSSSVPANAKTMTTSISFTFSASPAAGASFECKLDAGAFAGCTTPEDYNSLDGDDAVTGTAHTFQVRAKNGTGTDPSPASHSWTVDLVDPTATITNQPADPSSGSSAAFAFSANESVSKFECELEGPKSSALATCISGKTYSALPDGSYTFKVNAVDTAGNSGPVDSYTWEVDNSIADTTPPETKVLSGPADPTESTTASFTYESNEPGSTFKCKMDGEVFTDCPVSGKTYEGLSVGAHLFQVIATDSSGNDDESPASHSFSIVSVVPTPEIVPPAPVPPAAVVPSTKITSKPPAKTRDRTPTVKFNSSVAGATFQCKVDGGPFRSCRSPFTTKKLSFGKHKVQVRAASGGVSDPSPATVSFKVVKPKR